MAAAVVGGYGYTSIGNLTIRLTSIRNDTKFITKNKNIYRNTSNNVFIRK